MAGSRIRISRGRIYRRRILEALKKFAKKPLGSFGAVSAESTPKKIIRIGRGRPIPLSDQPSGLTDGGIHLTGPIEGERVPHRLMVEGRVADPNAEVWVVVHPMEGSDYWVQPPVSVRPDGHWRVMVYIGRPSHIDVGKYFEIWALASPKGYLREAMILPWWPKAKWKSPVIKVTRGDY